MSKDEKKVYLKKQLEEAERLVQVSLKALQTIYEESDEEVSQWKKLVCEYCGRNQNLEFATDDGDSPQTRILCYICTTPIKGYIVNRGYDVEFDSLFCPPCCTECGEEEAPLFVPKSSKERTAQQSLCGECIAGYSDE
jgi:protein-arginine kinase activator protein McsA